MKKYTSCSDCKTTNTSLLYLSGLMPKCKDCQNYANIVKKSKDKFVISFTREQFLEWKNSIARVCYYCGLAEEHIYQTNIINVRTKKRCETMGVDRLSSDLGYSFDNMVLCCPGCNMAKSNNLTPEEMLILGKTYRLIWESRIANSLR